MSDENVISSTQNEFVKMIRSLHDRKGRSERRMFLVEGKKCVDELLKYMPGIINTLIVTEGLPADDVVMQIEALGKRVQRVAPHVMKALCDCKTPQSLAAVADIPDQATVEDGFVIALDDVMDPANVGTIIRTADAAGCSAVVLSSGSADPFSPKAVRASMGSLFHLPVARTELHSRLDELLQKGYDVACAELAGTTDVCLDANRTCLVIGNESRGISEEIMKRATARIRIPIYGKAESLNAAVAAGILIYKIRT